MTSTVAAEVNPGLGGVDVLQTIFPCGSITGAPKMRAMERIDELEQAERNRRGPYTGSIGHVLASGDAEFNVAIRTLVLRADEREARYNVGSAIVIESDPLAEWRECPQKAAFVASTRDFRLLESLALGPRPSAFVTLHVDRLARSARELGFAFDRTRLEAELGRIGRELKSTVRMKISLERSGVFRFESSPLPAIQKSKVTVSIAARKNPDDDFRLHHKTSDRSFYDNAREAAGTFEVLFTDEHGFLTEGSFTNIFVADGKRLLTPPLGRGLLPGVLRQHLIETGAAVEKDLRLSDLAAEFWIGNSLRGLVAARLRPDKLVDAT